MKRRAWTVYAFWILLTEAVGALAALLTREGTELYNAAAAKPPLTPPPVVFPIVWTILYALMGVGAARAALTEPSARRSRALRLYALQLGFNFFWSSLFFNLRAYGFALVWLAALWALVLAMLLAFRRLDRQGWALQIPYLVWVTFALYLNAGVWILNR